MSYIADLFAKAKAYLVAEATKVEDAISPAVHTLAHTILNSVSVSFGKIGADALQAHQDGKPLNEILDAAKSQVLVEFHTQGTQILEDAALAAAKSIVTAHLADIVANVKTDDTQHINQ